MRGHPGEHLNGRHDAGCSHRRLGHAPVSLRRAGWDRTTTNVRRGYKAMDAREATGLKTQSWVFTHTRLSTGTSPRSGSVFSSSYFTRSRLVSSLFPPYSDFTILISRVTALHIVQATRSRLWFLFPTACLAGIAEIIGWSGRLWSSRNPTLLDPFLMQCVTRLRPSRSSSHIPLYMQTGHHDPRPYAVHCCQFRHLRGAHSTAGTPV